LREVALLAISIELFRRAAVIVIVVGMPFIASAAEAPPRPTNPYAGSKEAAKEGASLLNQYCAHCHGQWADQGERVRDLRRLHIRYGDDAISVFYSTVSTGRLDKGMPVWKGVLSDEILWKIFTFLETVQTEE
jgi:mono/diheme cytochrome c family protein